MKVLIIGSGAREHAIAWKLRQSPRITGLLAAPGNAGTAQLATNVPVAAGDIDGLLALVKERSVGFTVVGPEAPLAAGIVDRFQEAGHLIFGPTEAAARIETSKVFAKELMLGHGVPTGTATTFSSYSDARDYLESAPLPLVVKADGLAAGKGVVVAQNREEAQEALRRSMVDRVFGVAGERVLVEEHLEGEEISVFAFVDGETVSQMVAARDYKRASDGDQGPNTGGMGSFSPPPEWTAELEGHIRTDIMEPVVRALASEGSPYTGMLYAGLMLTSDGPKVLEFNCRLGDPETQVILPRLKSDLLDVMMRTAQGGLAEIGIEWDPRPCVAVVLASGGYPGAYDTGYPVAGLDDAGDDVTVFHAGTRLVPGETGGRPEVVTDGGRVLTVAALGDTITEARGKAYGGVTRISFQDSFYRHDIADLG